MAEKLIEISRLSKKYNSKYVLKDIDLIIEKGQSIALTGHNGSGKSTLLKLISGLTKKDAGIIYYHQKLSFHYIPEHFPRLTISAKKYMEQIADLEGLSVKERNETLQELFQRFYLSEMIYTPMKFLSKGTLQKVGVVQALLTQPDVLLLDEPLSGQDADSQAAFISSVKELNKKGVTILMSCHEPFLIECLSDIIYEIKDGHLELLDKNKINHNKMDILSFQNPYDHQNLPEALAPLTESIRFENTMIHLVADQNQSNTLILKMLENGYELRGMRSEIIS